MAYKDFRDFLAALQKQGELLEVDRLVALKCEVGKAMQKSAAIGGPAIVFNNNGTAFPLVGGVYNTRSKALLAFEATEDTITETIINGLAKPIPPITVTHAPTCENILKGKDIDLSALPILNIVHRMAALTSPVASLSVMILKQRYQI